MMCIPNISNYNNKTKLFLNNKICNTYCLLFTKAANQNAF